MRRWLRPVRAGFRLMLRAYPRRFRAEFAGEMEAALVQALAEAAERGPRHVAAVWGRELCEWPAAVLLAHKLEQTQGGRLAMVSSIATGRERPGRYFYFGWVAATVAGMCLAWILTLAVLAQITGLVGGRIVVAGQSRITEDYLLNWILFPVIGLLTGCLQYFFLRRYLPRAGWWITATALGWVLISLALRLFAAPGHLLSAILGGSGVVSVAVAAALLGGLLAVPQWLVLRPRVPHAGGWLAISVLGWLAAALVTGPTIDSALEALTVAAIPTAGASLALWLLLDRLAPRPAEAGRA